MLLYVDIANQKEVELTKKEKLKGRGGCVSTLQLPEWKVVEDEKKREREKGRGERE